MLLKNLIKDISKNKKNITVSGLSTNSKEIKKNFIFFAIRGSKFNGEKKFIGYFTKAIDAALAFDMAYVELSGKWKNNGPNSQMNFPNGLGSR